MPLRAPKQALEAAIGAAVQELGVRQVPELELGRARNPEHGDYSTSVAMKLARELQRPPAQIAAERSGLEPQELDRLLDPARMTEPGLPSG